MSLDEIVARMPLEFLLSEETTPIGKHLVGIHILTRAIIRLEGQIGTMIILSGYSLELMNVLRSARLLRELRGSLLDKTFVLFGPILSSMEVREALRDHR